MRAVVLYIRVYRVKRSELTQTGIASAIQFRRPPFKRQRTPKIINAPPISSNLEQLSGNITYRTPIIANLLPYLREFFDYFPLIRVDFVPSGWRMPYSLPLPYKLYIWLVVRDGACL